MRGHLAIEGRPTHAAPGPRAAEQPSTLDLSHRGCSAEGLATFGGLRCGRTCRETRHEGCRGRAEVVVSVGALGAAARVRGDVRRDAGCLGHALRRLSAPTAGPRCRADMASPRAPQAPGPDPGAGHEGLPARGVGCASGRRCIRRGRPAALFAVPAGPLAHHVAELGSPLDCIGGLRSADGLAARPAAPAGPTCPRHRRARGAKRHAGAVALGLAGRPRGCFPNLQARAHR
mmetsp:Transcript_18044/g.58296  ORF Transcript_18044/g.58296 Transcript_18044/m.58296 type:complete len:232 (-) Transcript_18044:667-1362(-)